MKNLIVTFTLLSTTSVFAQIPGKKLPASKQEKAVLCKAIDKSLADGALDFAVDLKKCLKTKMKTRVVSEGILETSGKIPFNSPERKFDLDCEVSFYALDNKLVAEPACN